MNLRLVTTVMVASALGWVRNIGNLINGEAVYHDITNKSINYEDKNKKIPTLEPEEAAQNLLAISEKNDFTLFEYFLTDRAGHKTDLEAIKTCLSKLGKFVVEIKKGINSSTSLVLTSDHGNIEDINVKTHTRNLVPFLAINLNPGNISKINIEDIFSILTKEFSYG